MGNLKRLVITCGGTGGHFYPGLSIARDFKEHGEVKLLLSGEHAPEQKKIADKFAVDTIALPKMPRLGKAPIQFAIGFIKGFFAAYKELKNCSPQALLGMGSFATLPVILAAFFRRIPIFLHDGNARIGKANRWFSYIAKAAGCAYPAVNASKCRCPLTVCGMPLRPELREKSGISRNEAIAEINKLFETDFDVNVPLILITGGSLGAEVFNTVLPEALKMVSGKFQIVHLSGKTKLEKTVEHYAGLTVKKLLLETTSAMDLFLAAADLVFSRSGGSTTAELALFGKNSILVPYPYAAEGHQMDNARYFESHQAAVVVKNSDLTVEKASELIRDFLNNDPALTTLCENMKTLARPEASKQMLEEISNYID